MKPKSVVGRIPTIILAFLVLGATFARADQGAQQVVGPRHQLPAQGREHRYTTIGRDPRGPSVRSWADAITWMSGQGWKNDVEIRLAKVMPAEFQSSYLQVVVPAAKAIVKAASEHHYMAGRCPKCGDPCSVQKDLAKKFKRVRIPHGTRYLGVTHNVHGKVIPNMRYLPEGEYFAYRLYLNDLPLKESRDDKGVRCVTYGSTYFDLIVKCSNAALGEFEVWMVQFMPPVKPVIREVKRELLVVKPESHAKAEAQAEAQAEASAEANARAEGGSVVNNNIINFPQPVVTYTPAAQTQVMAWNYRAGGLTFQAVPRISVRQSQQQQQQQWQDQWQNLYNSITNNNVNQNLVQVPIAIANAP